MRSSQVMLHVCCVIVLLAGCKVSHYRKQADQEANCLVDQKAAVAGIEPAQYRIEVDPRSRMYDPHNPDCEPMPPDDPTSHRYMQCVDCKKGSKCWKCLPKTPFVENPGWNIHLPYDDQGQLVLDLPGAVEMALIQSPRYQSQLEELYLSALDVSFERFRFDTQFFGGSSIFFTADGRERTGTGSSSSLLEVSPLDPENRLTANRLTATGGELVVGLANSLVWQFAGPDDYTSSTLLDFSFVQPLLRAGGRTRVLERLTISERALLANVRQMERYRRGFYVSVVTGRDPGAGPSRRGGVFGGSGLEGFSGVGGDGFGRVGQNNNGGGGGGGGNTGGAGAQGAGGYLGLLQTAQVLRNQRSNVFALRDSVEQLQASYDAGRIDRFQVDLTRQALFNAQSQLLSAEVNYKNNLDNFKVGIGLPPELNTKISDPLLDQFNLLDPDLEELKTRVTLSLNELREIRASQEGNEEERGVVLPLLPEAPGMEFPLRDQLKKYLAEAYNIREETKAQLLAVDADYQELQAALPERIAYLEKLAQRSEVLEAGIDPALFNSEEFRERVIKSLENFESVAGRIAKTLQRIDQIAEMPVSNERESLSELVNVFTVLSGQLLELTLVQASARLETINFQPIGISPEQGLAIASVYRRDWQNARAALVDSWRLIYFNANDLLSSLDLVFSGDLGNVGDNPFKLNGRNGRLRVGLEFDAPLTRLAERNVYRQSLIEYQQARRSYYQFRDQIYQGLRNTLRQVRLNEVNFELRRAAVQVAIAQVDLTQLRLSEPPKPGETSQFGNTTARDLVQSLSDLLNVQNDFLSVWVNYEVQRLNLELDLGVMELTPYGLRMENNMPLENYLIDLPINSADLGLASEGCVISEQALPNQEFVPPELILPGEGWEEAEPLPLPNQEPAGRSDNNGKARKDMNRVLEEVTWTYDSKKKAKLPGKSSPEPPRTLPSVSAHVEEKIWILPPENR